MGNSRFVYPGWYGDRVGTFRARPELCLFCIDMIEPKLVTEVYEPGGFALDLQCVWMGPPETVDLPKRSNRPVSLLLQQYLGTRSI